MADINITIDDKDFVKGVGELLNRVTRSTTRGVKAVADEVLRLSQFEVPHNIGLLQNSGATDPISDVEEMVGYNKVYAARLHEHPEYRFQKGRKGKYLEDPIKRNLSVFLKFMGIEIQKEL